MKILFTHHHFSRLRIGDTNEKTRKNKGFRAYAALHSSPLYSSLIFYSPCEKIRYEFPFARGLGQQPDFNILYPL